MPIQFSPFRNGKSNRDYLILKLFNFINVANCRKNKCPQMMEKINLIFLSHLKNTSCKTYELGLSTMLNTHKVAANEEAIVGFGRVPPDMGNREAAVRGGSR